MDGFWIDPPGANDPNRLAPAWEAIVAYMQPSARRYMQPLRRARLIIRTSTGLAVSAGVWGLVPAWATSGERRQLALRHAVLDAELAPDSTVTGEIWSDERHSRRCLVAASGWVAATSLGSLVAYAPEVPPVTFAAMHSVIAGTDGKSVTTFGVFARGCSLGPYDGSRVPIVIRAEDRNSWLRSRPNDARRLLKIPGMKVHAHRISSPDADIDAVLGAGYSREWDGPPVPLGPVTGNFR